MKVNDFQSPFQLVENRIAKLNIKNGILSLEDKDLSHEISRIDYQVGDIQKIEDKYWGVLQLTIDLKIRKAKKIVYSLSLITEGAFTGDSGSINRKDFQNMLEINGTSSLYSIARSTIITVSALSSISGQLRLPMLNIVSLYQSKHQKIDSTELSKSSTEDSNENTVK